jgi:hypothetical protein
MQTYNRAMFGNIPNHRDCTSAKSYPVRRGRRRCQTVKQQAEPWSGHSIRFFSAAVCSVMSVTPPISRLIHRRSLLMSD